jgi:S1-C subfamily serine protease
MFKRKSSWVVLGVVVILVLAGLSLFKVYTGSNNLIASEPVTKLGFTYLPVSQQSACCYGLTAADSGAEVTSLIKGGALDAAGIQEGDVIVSCNGVQVSQACPLLGLIKSCPAGEDLNLGVYDGSSQKTVTVLAETLRSLCP